jgi:hypothetical protein
MKTLTGVPRTQASRERALPSLDHHPSDRVPIRFWKHSGHRYPPELPRGDCAITSGEPAGAGSRADPMAGMLDEDLKPAMRIDGEGVYRAKTSSVSATSTGIVGACQTGRKSWCRRSFAVTRDRNRDILLCRKPI